MEIEESSNRPAAINSLLGEDPCEPASEAFEADSLPLEFEVREELIVDDLATTSDGHREKMTTVLEINVEKDDAEKSQHLPLNSGLVESDAVLDASTPIATSVRTENISPKFQFESSLNNHNKNGDSLSGWEVDPGSPSVVKKPKIIADEQQPSVHVVYNSLSKDSKRKLQELLQQWSQWHARNCSSLNDSNEAHESGEETYFPALCINLDKTETVAFWVDKQLNQSSNEPILLDDTSVPLYDRGYSLALTSADASSSLNSGVETLDTSRCFNCGSYNHAMKDCTKPRDNVAVNKARKQHKSKRIRPSNSHQSNRYYQSSRGGKYDGLRPGVLDSETRQLLGLGELDPPPWLNRMREIGYPPGYIESDEDDEPSGITIFGEEAIERESEDGEILDASHGKPPKKMKVEFPGINAPIPEEADDRLWAPSYSSMNIISGIRSLPRHDQSSDYLSRGRYHYRSRSGDFEDDDGPPGCEPGTSPSLSNHFRRYVDHDSGYYSLSPQASPSLMNWNATFDRSLSERGRSSPWVRDNASPSHGKGVIFPPSPR